MIGDIEKNMVRKAIEMAIGAGAQKARVTFSRSGEDLVATLNGEPDKVTHCADVSMNFALFVDGKFGSFSTNKTDEDSLRDFIGKAVGIVRMVSEDPCRDLPSPERCCKEAGSGLELGLVDSGRDGISPDMRIGMALEASIYGKEAAVGSDGRTYRIISEEGEYSDSIYDTVVMDSSGLCCVHSETSFDYGVEVTIECDGEKYSGYWWESSSRRSGLDLSSCGRKALEKAVGQIGSGPAESGTYNMVVDTEVASKMVSPLLRALNAFALQQNNSFLMDSLGKKLFPDGLTVMDLPHIYGQTCSKLFDSEGVATSESMIIDKGTVSRYFVNTYMSNKLGIAPTIEDATRPKVLPWPRAGLDRQAILGLCGDGILVTDFNGGNSNSVTGDFSYGIEGFLFRDGRIVRPVSGMLVTGNFIGLWQNLIAAGDDARDCMSKLIPTLAFSNVDFSG